MINSQRYDGRIQGRKTAVALIVPAALVTPTAPPAPQYRPFDLDAETSGKQSIEDDQ